MSNNIWFRTGASLDEIDPNARPESSELSLSDLPDVPLSLSQPSSRPRNEFVESRGQDVFQPPAQRPRIEGSPNFGRPGSAPLNPGPPIFPPLSTRVPDRPEPSAANRGEVRFIGDLLPGQARVLGQFLWVGGTEEGGPLRYFEATYEGPNDDHYWGLIACPLPPREGAVNWGHNRWLLGHPKELSED
jgi:hypothetical protein